MSDSAARARGTHSARQEQAHAEHEEDVQRFRWFIMAGLITAAIMEVLDSTIVNVALPQMAGNLGATNQEIGWVATGYILSNVVVLPMTAFFSTRFGRRNYLCFSIIVFIISSFLCGTSHSLVELVMWRICQGAGGAALLSTAQATIRQIFPRDQQGMVQAIFILGIIVAPTLGPTLGGWITDNYTWNWCFFINIPIGITSVFLVTEFLKDPPGMRKKVSVDYLGIGLLAVGLACLQYVLEEGQQNDWFQDAMITRLAILSGACLIAMLIWELHPRNLHPVVDFRVLKNSQLSSSIALFIALGLGLYGGVYLFPLFTQNILQFTPTETGLALFPGGIATAIAALICGRLLNGPRALIDPRIMIYTGMGMFTVSMWQLGHMTILSGEADTQLALIIRGFGLGCLFTPLNQLAYGSVNPKEAQQASGLINLSRQLGGSFGIAILGTFVVNHAAFHRANLVTHLNSGNPLVEQRLNMMAGALTAHGYAPAVAQKAAYGLLDQTVMQQAYTMAYNDGFLFILLVFAACAPIILILRRPRVSATPGEMH